MPSCCTPIKVESKNSTSIAVKWEEDCTLHNGKNITYCIFYQLLGSILDFNCSSSPTQFLGRQYTAFNLVPNTSYIFYLALQNIIGRGNYTTLIETTNIPTGKMLL